MGLAHRSRVLATEAINRKLQEEYKEEEEDLLKKDVLVKEILSRYNKKAWDDFERSLSFSIAQGMYYGEVVIFRHLEKPGYTYDLLLDLRDLCSKYDYFDGYLSSIQSMLIRILHMNYPIFLHDFIDYLKKEGFKNIECNYSYDIPYEFTLWYTF